MKVLFVLPRMVVGGIERVRLILVRRLLTDGAECHLALRKCYGELLSEARSLVPVVELAPRGMHQFVPALARLLRNERPTHIVTAFPDIGVLAWCAIKLSGHRPKWIHSSHGTHEAAASRPGVWGRLRHEVDGRVAAFAYRHADRVVAVSEGIRSEIVDGLRIESSKVLCIYNPIIPDEDLRPLSRAAGSGETWRIVAIGRLSREKGFDVLVDAMRMVPQPWRLDVFGEGPEKANLEELVNRYGLQAFVHLRGYTNRPLDVLRSSDLLVVPSRHEGFGNVVVEALAGQCQVVATDCPVGPREILNGGKLGQVVPVGNPGALAHAIRNVIEGRFRVAADAMLARAHDFSQATGCAKWERLLVDVLNDK